MSDQNEAGHLQQLRIDWPRLHAVSQIVHKQPETEHILPYVVQAPALQLTCSLCKAHKLANFTLPLLGNLQILLSCTSLGWVCWSLPHNHLPL